MTPLCHLRLFRTGPRPFRVPRRQGWNRSAARDTASAVTSHTRCSARRTTRTCASCEHETRISGAPAVLWVGFGKDGLTWTGPGGEPTWYATWPTLRRGFCPRCGTHLISVADDSDMIMVTGFSLDDRSGTDPVGHSYRQEAVPWMTIALADGPHVPRPASP